MSRYLTNPPTWLNVLLGAVVHDVYQVCVDIDGVVEDASLALLETSKGVVQVHAEVHSEQHVVGARLVDDIHSPVTTVDYTPWVLRPRLVDAIGDPVEVAEIQYVSEGGAGDDYLDTGGFLIDASGQVRLVVWAFRDEAIVDRPESVWVFMHKWIQHVREARVVSVRASDLSLDGQR